MERSRQGLRILRKVHALAAEINRWASDRYHGQQHCRRNQKTDGREAGGQLVLDVVTFEGACRRIETALAGDTRQQVLIDLSKSKTFAKALLRLRDSMRSGVFKVGSDPLHLNRIIKTFDSQNAQEGFHVLHDWDGNADR